MPLAIMLGTIEFIILLALLAWGALIFCGIIAVFIIAVKRFVERGGNPGVRHDSNSGGSISGDNVSPAAHAHDGSSGYALDSGGYTHGGCDSSFSSGDSGGGDSGGGGGGD